MSFAPGIAEARALFPRGLAQPARGFRFSMDALLLACFARAPRSADVLDLGAGCGVVGLALLLRAADADLRVTGLDASPEMLACARENAARLGLSRRYATLDADVRGIRDTLGVRPGSFGLTLCNPPYRRPGSGRLPMDTSRRMACFEEADVADFACAASLALKERGRTAWVFPAERLAALLTALCAAGLSPKRLRLVHGRADKPARLALVEAVKGAGEGLVAEPSLVLFEADSMALRADALAFCPFLSCNPGRDEEAS